MPNILQSDLLIIGSGSAGLPAGMYASRYGISNIIVGTLPGWSLTTAHMVENFPGFISSPGRDIMRSFRAQAEKSGSTIIDDTVTSLIRWEKGNFLAHTSSDKEIESSYVLFATGSSYRKLGIPGEKEFLGRGVSYCATCDGNFFRGLRVAVVGGGDSALTEALYLAGICEEVHLIHRRDTFRAEQSWIEKVKTTPNITIHYSLELAEIRGDFGVEKIVFRDGSMLNVQGVFVAVGSTPNTELADPLGVSKDAEGYICVNAQQKTNISHIYAAGDVTTNSDKFKQTIMSAAEWCLAAHSIHEEMLLGKDK